MHTIYLDALRHREQEFMKYAVILVSAIGAFLFVLSDFRFSASIKQTDQETRTNEGSSQRGGRTERYVEHATSQPSTRTARASHPVEPVVERSQRTSSGNQSRKLDRKTVQTTRTRSLGVEKSANVKCIVSLFCTLALCLGATYCAALGYNYRCLTLQVAKIEAELDIRRYMLVAWRNKVERLLRNCSATDAHKARPRVKFRPPEVIQPFYWACVVGIVGICLAAITVVDPAWYWKAVVGVGNTGLVVLALGSLRHYGKKYSALVAEECEEKTDEPWWARCLAGA